MIVNFFIIFHISMCKTMVSPLITHHSYRSLVLSHRYKMTIYIFEISFLYARMITEGKWISTTVESYLSTSISRFRGLYAQRPWHSQHVLCINGFVKKRCNSTADALEPNLLGTNLRPNFYQITSSRSMDYGSSKNNHYPLQFCLYNCKILWHGGGLVPPPCHKIL